MWFSWDWNTNGKITTVSRLFWDSKIKTSDYEYTRNETDTIVNLVECCVLQGWNISYKWPLHIWCRITIVPRLFSEHFLKNENIRLWMHTQNGTLWYLFCLILATCFRPENISSEWLFRVSGKITTILDYIKLQNGNNIRSWMYTPNETVGYPFWLVWLSIVSGLKTLVISDWYVYVVKSQPGLFSKYSEMRTNIRSGMHICTLNGTVWYLFCLVWSSSNTFSCLKTLVISDR